MKLGAEENNQMEWNKSIIRQPFTRTNNKCRLIVKDRSVFNQCPKLHSLSLSLRPRLRTKHEDQIRSTNLNPRTSKKEENARN
jgi:hypothetical protein